MIKIYPPGSPFPPGHPLAQGAQIVLGATMRKLIRTDGTVIDLPRALTTEQVGELIDADSLDFVSLHHLGRPLHVMAVDDRGWETETVELTPSHFELRPIRARKPINAEATRLYLANYCIPGTTHQIVGDVVVMPDSDSA